MSSRKDPRTGNWFFRKWVRLPTGKRKRIFGATDDAGQPFKKKSDSDTAELAAIKALSQPDKPPMPTFAIWFHGRFWNEWVLGGPRGANSPAEQEAKRSIYRVHLEEFFGPLPIDRIDEQLINAFRSQLRAPNAKGWRPSEKTINNILAVLSKPLKYAERVKLIPSAPHVGVAKVERPEIEFIEFEEFAELMRSAREDKQPEFVIAILLSFEAGLRIGEIKALRWPNVDMRARTITVVEQVRPVKDERGKYVETFGPPKGRRRRTVSMSPALHAALRDRLRTGFVIPGQDGQHKTTSAVRSAIERIAKRAGLADKIVGEWHIGRHTFGTHAALLGVNPWVLQEWMGHKRGEETQLYADVARAHGRPVPPELIAAGEGITDPSLRVMAQLSARALLAAPSKKRAASGQRTRGGKK